MASELRSRMAGNPLLIRRSPPVATNGRAAPRAAKGSKEESRIISPEDLSLRNENGCDRRVRPHPPPRRSGDPPGCPHPGRAGVFAIRFRNLFAPAYVRAYAVNLLRYSALFAGFTATMAESDFPRPCRASASQLPLQAPAPVNRLHGPRRCARVGYSSEGLCAVDFGDSCGSALAVVPASVLEELRLPKKCSCVPCPVFIFCGFARARLERNAVRDTMLGAEPRKLLILTVKIRCSGGFRLAGNPSILRVSRSIWLRLMVFVE